MQAPMGDLVHGSGSRVARVMANTEGNGAERQRAVWVDYSDEYRAEAAIRPRNVGLDATAKPGAVAAFCLTSH